MTDIDLDSNVPGVTRLVRAGALLAAQGVAVGFAINTLRLWSRLPDFVASNKMSVVERGGIVAWLILPAVSWSMGMLIGSALNPRVGHRLQFLEHWSRRSAWVIALGLFPVLLHPTLWRTRTLMFLLTTAMVSIVAWSAFRLTQKAAFQRREASGPSDFEQLSGYVTRLTPPRLRLLLPLLVIAVGVIYIITRGVWLDPTAVPRLVGDPPVGVHSVRQAFVILGHGGWLGVPIVALKFLRPPGHAHIFFWSLCIATAAFPLYLWAKSHLGSKIALIVASCYLCMPTLRTIGRQEVLPLGLAAGLFFLAAPQWERKRYESALVVSLLTLGVNEQAAWWFCCLGLYFATNEGTRTAGHWLVAGAIAYFVLIAGLVLPYLGVDAYHGSFKGLWGSRAVGLFETLRVAVTNPAYVLARWFELQGLLFWLVLFVPFAFLPLVARNWLLWLAPGVVFAVVGVGHLAGMPVTTGAAAHFIVLGFAAAVTTLTRLSKTAATRQQASAAVLAWVFAVIPCVYQLGAIWLPAL